MRAAAAAALAALLVACGVDVEGAPCTTSANCPAGQGCGADQRCSARALACAPCRPGEARCGATGVETCVADGVCTGWSVAACSAPQTCKVGTAGPACACPDLAAAAGAGCAGPGTLTCDGAGAKLLACAADAASSCLVWQVSEDCAASSLVCGGAAASPACACAAAGTTVYVDASSPSNAARPPTGALAPPECRFKVLAPALAALNARTKAVVAMNGPARFAEALPAVPAGATLETAEGAQAGAPAYVVELTAPLVLGEGSSLTGFELRPSPSLSARIDAIQTACAAKPRTPTSVSAVRVASPDPASGTPFAAAIHQQGGCPLDVLGADLAGNDVGIHGTGGALVVEALQGTPTRVSGGTTGILLESSAGAANVQLSSVVVEDARDSGIQVRQLATGSTLAMNGNTVARNCARTLIPMLGGAPSRGGGGILFYGNLPALTFTANAVYGNAYDQILVANTIGTASLDLVGDASAAAGTCPAAGKENAIGFPDLARSGVGVFSSGARVAATGNAWTGYPPTADIDFGGAVDATGASGGAYCQPVTLAKPAARTCE